MKLDKHKIIDLLIPFIRIVRKTGIIPNRPIINDRAIEYGFMASELNMRKSHKILDVGCLESPVSFMLAGLGAKVYGLDLRDSPIDYPGIKFIKGDIRNTDFKDKEFDRIVAISTLEHLGLSKRYTTNEMNGSDLDAIKELKRILKDDGILIITVPFGVSAVDEVQRTYDSKSINRLIRDFEVISKKYALHENNYWRLAEYKEVKNITGYHANILLSLKKKDDEKNKQKKATK